jgi:hypothetical protein
VGGFYTTNRFYTTTHAKKMFAFYFPALPQCRGPKLSVSQSVPDHPELSFGTLIPHFGFWVLYPRGILGTSHAKVPVVLS